MLVAAAVVSDGTFICLTTIWALCFILEKGNSNRIHAQKAIAKYQRKRRQITMDAASAQLLDPRRLGMAVPRLGVNTS